MALQSLPVLGNLESSIVEISQEKLRAVLFQIEAELQQSEVYKRTLKTLQRSLGEANGGAQFLIRALAREAIRLAFKQLEIEAQPKFDSESSARNVEEPAAGTSPSKSCQAPGSSPRQQHKDKPVASAAEKPHLSNPNHPKAEKPEAIQPPQKTQSSQELKSKFFKRKRKATKAEFAAQQAAEIWEERIREIGEELKQARLAQSLSQKQLHSQTHVPLYQIQALEQGAVEKLPEDIYVRGFIRSLSSALGLDGNALLETLPSSNLVQAVVPSWYGSAPEPGTIRPVHIYVGYAALMAGAMGGLVWMSHQNAPEAGSVPFPVPTAEPAISQQSSRKAAPTTKPGVKASKIGIVAGPDIAPPEILPF